MHYFTVQVVDEKGEESGRIANDVWVVNEEEYKIKNEEIYNITEDDLTEYNITINLDNTATAEQMQNNRVGLSRLFLDARNQGYRKVILPQATYRVNRTVRLGAIEDGTTCIDIPSGLTVDMNQSTFKLHPYNDAEYGAIAQTENLMVRMRDCVDSHLINGTIEGDYAERQANGWISGSNGEHNNTVYIYGGCYNTLENVKIYQTTGYNVCTGQNGSLDNTRIGTFTDGIKLVDGQEVEAEGYCVSSMATLSNTSNYIVASIWLAMGGLKGSHWDVEFNFYDENQQFIEKIRCYQYRRCRIPNEAVYVRTTFKGTSSDISGIGYHHMNVARYCEIKNCEWVDNRTCCAPFQHQHLYFNKCNFTRSGQSITPCEIDLEDGWEQMQDFFLIDCHVLEHSGTAYLISNSGINHVVENCTGWQWMKMGYRINGITIRNNINCGCSVTTGFMTRNTVRVCDNEFVQMAGNSVDNTHYLHEEMTYKYKNNIIKCAGFENFKPYWHVDNCVFNIVGFQSNVTLENSIIRIKSGSAYLNNDLIYDDCTFELYEGDTETKFSFNLLDTYRLYDNCIFDNPVNLATHNYFNSGVFKDCVFNENITIANTSATKVMGELAFINCKFNKTVTANNKNNSQIQFINCEFVEGITYGNTYAQALCEFIDEKPNDIAYLDISADKEYLKFGETATITSLALPFYIENPNISWTVDNDLATIDENLLVTTNNEVGEFKVKGETPLGFSQEKSFKVVDVDYVEGKVYNTSGGYNTYTYSATDNIYKDVTSGASITITSPNINVSRTIIAEYDIDKNFVKIQNVTTKPATVTLGSTTKYIRVSFYVGTKEVKKTQLIYEYTITEN